jgi:hypothetical protein
VDLIASARPILAAAAAVFLSGCEVYAVPSPLPCPGERQGLFDFAAEQVVTANDCFFAQPANAAYQVLGSFGFPATVNFAAEGDGAALCKQVAHALPNLGTHTGVSIDVASEAGLSVGGCTCLTPEAAAAGACLCPPNTPQTCSCPVVQEQRIRGDLVAIPGGFSGFEGVILYTVKPPPLPPLAQPCDCHVTCTYSYALTATTVGTR